MKTKFSFVNLLILLGFMSMAVVCQTQKEQTSQVDLLPALSEPPGCELILRYIDDALDRAYKEKSNFIVIVRMQGIKNITLAQTRLNNLKKYIRYRGFTNFEVLLDPNTNGAEQFELFVRSERLYSIPIKKKDKLNLAPCVIGPELEIKNNN